MRAIPNRITEIMKWPDTRNVLDVPDLLQYIQTLRLDIQMLEATNEHLESRVSELQAENNRLTTNHETRLQLLERGDTVTSL